MLTKLAKRVLKDNPSIKPMTNFFTPHMTALDIFKAEDFFNKLVDESFELDNYNRYAIDEARLFLTLRCYLEDVQYKKGKLVQDNEYVELSPTDEGQPIETVIKAIEEQPYQIK